jgi:hypothetical protein
MNLIPGLSLRASEEAEIDGLDGAEIGEMAYDFVQSQRNYLRVREGVKTEFYRPVLLLPFLGQRMTTLDTVHRGLDRG